MSFVIGIDLGRNSDYSAMVIDEVSEIWPPGKIPDPLLTKKDKKHDIRFLKRWPIGTPYTQQIDDIKMYLNFPELAGSDSPMIVDGTGVGVAVVDMLLKEKLPCRLIPITIHGGEYVSRAGAGYRVAKKQLASSLQAVMQKRLISFASDLPHTERNILMNELRTFVVKMNQETGHESYEALKSTQHDDMCLSLMYAVWYSEKSVERAPPLRTIKFKGKEKKHTPRVVIVVGEDLHRLDYDQPALVISVVDPEPVGNLNPPQLSFPVMMDDPYIIPFLDNNPDDFKDTWWDKISPYDKTMGELLVQENQSKKLWQFLLKKRILKDFSPDPIIYVHAKEERTALTMGLAISDGLGLKRETILSIANPDKRYKEEIAPSAYLYRIIKSGKYSIVS